MRISFRGFESRNRIPGKMVVLLYCRTLEFVFEVLEPRQQQGDHRNSTTVRI